MATSCAVCNSQETGRFCSQCGAPLEQPVQCGGCGSPLPEGARFCNMCGHSAGAEGSRSTSATSGGGERRGGPSAAGGGGSSPSARAGWIVAGLAVAALVVVTLFLNRDDSATPGLANPSIAAAGGPSDIDLSSMTPRDAADRLFNRVMESVSLGDSAQARAFAPMAIAAYDRVDALDLDGRYHVAVLHLVSDDPEASLQAADLILEEAPQHLFALYTAAQAREMMGDETGASLLYQDFLANYDAEIALDRPEYRDHSPLLPMMREDAQERGS